MDVAERGKTTLAIQIVYEPKEDGILRFSVYYLS